LFAGLEERNLLGWDFHPVTSLGVTSYARITLTGAEAAKPANLNLIARPQRTNNTVKNGFNNDLTVTTGNIGQAGDFFDKISFRHKLYIPPEIQVFRQVAK